MKRSDLVAISVFITVSIIGIFMAYLSFTDTPNLNSAYLRYGGIVVAIACGLIALVMIRNRMNKVKRK